ncbi:MAG: hypothetical protein ACJAS9_003437 [Polaribacter sp.]|jgi:hypothetical protein
MPLMTHDNEQHKKVFLRFITMGVLVIIAGGSKDSINEIILEYPMGANDAYFRSRLFASNVN